MPWSDINKMVWSEVREEFQDGEKTTKVYFTQEKTLGVEYLYISEQARELLGKRKYPSDRVFIDLKY